jgi:hypothetical protein
VIRMVLGFWLVAVAAGLALGMMSWALPQGGYVSEPKVDAGHGTTRAGAYPGWSVRPIHPTRNGLRPTSGASLTQPRWG